MDRRSISRIDARTTLIDFELLGVWGAGAVYLVRGRRSCLIDSGTRTEAPKIIAALDSIGAFPPDLVVLTHSHWDHSQGAPVLCEEARRRGKRIELMASAKGIEKLADQSWNSVFHAKRLADIPGVTPLEHGQLIDLDGAELAVLDLAGHCGDDIALFDERAKRIFVGDAVGYKIDHTLLFPPFMPPFWDETGFRAAVDRLRGSGYEELCLAHFGCLLGEEAARFPDDALAAFEGWWGVFAEADAAGRLDDWRFIKRRLLEEVKLELPRLELAKPSMKLVLGAINAARRLLLQKPLRPADIQLKGIIQWLAMGYRGARPPARA